MRRRRTLLIVAGAVALVAVARHPTADIEILTHQTNDLSPHRFQAAVDLGVVAINFLVTWTGHRVAS